MAIAPPSSRGVTFSAHALICTRHADSRLASQRSVTPARGKSRSRGRFLRSGRAAPPGSSRALLSSSGSAKRGIVPPSERRPGMRCRAGSSMLSAHTSVPTLNSRPSLGSSKLMLAEELLYLEKSSESRCIRPRRLESRAETEAYHSRPFRPSVGATSVKLRSHTAKTSCASPSAVSLAAGSPTAWNGPFEPTSRIRRFSLSRRGTPERRPSAAETAGARVRPGLLVGSPFLSTKMSSTGASAVVAALTRMRSVPPPGSTEVTAPTIG
mmetsp:Transcript_21149/g.53569  ORF Transcript_21149/g.53569 Transcript_21149/m.53569 type:complete len:268 (+) Transcript_21149:893-1696(+)